MSTATTKRRRWPLVGLAISTVIGLAALWVALFSKKPYAFAYGGVVALLFLFCPLAILLFAIAAGQEPRPPLELTPRGRLG